MNRVALQALACGALAASALAQAPRMGGEMSHVLVSLYQQRVYISLERPDEVPLTMRNYQERYSGSAGVLDRSGYNAQFGWLANGFISLPSDAAMWIESIDQTPELRTFEQGTFAPIFGTAGSSSLWEWDGSMVHNWYSAVAIGDYTATYRVFVGEVDGSPYPGFTGGEITLGWTYPTGGLGSTGGMFADVRATRQIPAPGASLVIAAAGAVGVRRRR